MVNDKQEKVLITGGAGFVGYFLAERLAGKGREVTILDNLQRGRMDDDFRHLLDHNNVTFEQGDLTDEGVLATLDTDYDYIYHLAAIIGVKNVVRQPHRALSVNAISTLNVLQFARKQSRLKKLLFSSTSEIYAGTLKHFSIPVPTDESVALTIEDVSSKRSTYALSKMFGESVCYNFGEQYRIPFTIVRYHNVYGPRMGFAHVIPEMFIKLRDSDIVDVPSAQHTRAFCYIDDAVEMTVRLCEADQSTGETYHVGNADEEIAIQDLVQKIAKVMGRKIAINPLEPTGGSPARRCPDTSKMQRTIDYHATVTLEQGLRKTYDWYRDKLTQRHE